MEFLQSVMGFQINSDSVAFMCKWVIFWPLLIINTGAWWIAFNSIFTKKNRK